jgi:small nuclear ribonucleoprotein (snRNP)-like protein
VGKRQYRVAQKDIVSKAAELQGQKVQVILENNRVFSGLVQEVSATEVVLKDARFNIHRLSPDDVREVVYDKETLY